MINKLKVSDYPSFLSLWQEAFGDGEDFIKKYFDRFLEFVFCYREDDEIKAMLSLIPVIWGDKKGRYIYAVATFKKYRGQGISTRLLDFCKAYIKEYNEDFLVLVPQNDSLFDFYEKRGFKSVNCIKKEEIVPEKNNTAIREITAREYVKKRKEKFFNIIEWQEEELEKIKEIYGGKFLEGEKGEIAFCVEDKKSLYIKEYTGSTESFIKGEYEKVYATTMGNDAFIMTYPKKMDAYFNIAID